MHITSLSSISRHRFQNTNKFILIIPFDTNKFGSIIYALSPGTSGAADGGCECG